MNTTDILRTLHGLAAADRAWIIARLPARAKAQLLAMSPDAGAPSIAKVEAPEVNEGIPADIDAGRLASVLAEEPSWIAAALLDGSAGFWVASVLDRLPASMRTDIASIQRAGCTLTPHARQVLTRMVLARVGCGDSAPARSRFQSLLARVSESRSRKRLTIHL